MSKRKAGVNNIIYELDNDDIEISSEDEAKEAKINRFESKDTENIVLEECNNDERSVEACSMDLTEEETDKNISLSNTSNGGKILPIPPDNNLSNNQVTINVNSPSTHETESEVDSIKKLDTDGSKTTIYNEDIIIDSPASNSDLGVVGCENRTPLVTVRFRDRKLASTYKNKLKTFMLRLIKLHEEESSPGLDSETDIELDIWPEDLVEEDLDFDDEPVTNEPENLFFIDTDPCSEIAEIPTYKNVSTLISNHEEKEPSPPPIFRRGPTCFNCEGPHQLRDCPVPKNSARIAEKRKKLMVPRVGRYHVEDDQKYGHLIPGRISGRLRHALGLKRNELPLHIYRMRILGYPPGWLEEARISHSGITMFDSSGSAILDPDEEEGEVCEPGCKDKFDIKKILDFPGFNVAPSSQYKEEAHRYGLPPMSEQDSKIAMLQMLAPNAMKAYKRKKLTLFPSASNNTSIQEVAEMDLDSGDETAEFPSVPPLPDDAPPPPPPPPPKSPSPEPQPPGTMPSPSVAYTPPGTKPTSPATKPSPQDPKKSPPGSETEPESTQDKVDSDDDKSADDIEVLEVMKVRDIPIPEPELITIDDDDESLDEKDDASSGRESPTLDDLEAKKRLLLNALEGDESGASPNISSATEEDNKIDDDNKSLDETDSQADEATDVLDKDAVSDSPKDAAISEAGTTNVQALSPKEATTNETQASSEMAVSTPESKTGHVKTTSYGTPVMNIASSYVKLPSDDKFAKDICDVINFENLPNSTGKYKQICTMLKRVKGEVDRIQDS